jgi:hypothetical protein
MKTQFGLLVGFLGICMIPIAIIFVAFKASCNFVSKMAMEGLHDD